MVYEAAVLIEAGWFQEFDQVWVVEITVEEAKKRLMTRNNLSDEEAMKRINSQMSIEERRKHATVVIHNDGTVEQTRVAVVKVT